MAAKDKNTKERILDIAEHLIMSRGYNGFSYKDISTELNVKNAAIHYHFPSKKDLGTAVIKRARTRFKERSAVSEALGLTPVDILNESIKEYIGYLNSDDTLCLGGSLETDFHTLPEGMQNEVRIYSAEVLTWTRNMLSKGREEGLFAFSGPSEDMAFLLLSLIQGALQIAKVGNRDFFYRAVDKIKSEIGL